MLCFNVAMAIRPRAVFIAAAALALAATGTVASLHIQDALQKTNITDAIAGKAVVRCDLQKIPREKYRTDLKEALQKATTDALVNLNNRDVTICPDKRLQDRDTGDTLQAMYYRGEKPVLTIWIGENSISHKVIDSLSANLKAGNLRTGDYVEANWKNKFILWNVRHLPRSNTLYKPPLAS
jgi:hypothetical protein